MTTWLIILLVSAVATFGQEKSPPGDSKPQQPRLSEQQLNDEWRKLPLESKRRLLHLHRALTRLTPEERRFIHDRIDRFINMAPEEKRRVQENAERWKKMTPEEREQARRKFRERRRQFEEKWRREHPGEEPPPFPPLPPQKPPPPPDAPEFPNPEPNQKESP
jgi:hypothetical protein